MPLPAKLGRYTPLLEWLGIGDLPVATPLDVAQLPIVRPTLTLEEPDAEGNRPLSAWEVRAWQTDPSGVRREVIIRGSRTEGLPYGRDGDVILALSHLIAENGYYDGVLRDISLQRIAAALGKELDGREARRIVSALSRLAGVQVEIAMPLVEPEEVNRLLSGELTPQAPPRSRSRKVRRAKFSLLTFLWETETLEQADGSTAERIRIRHLAMEPVLVHYAIAGGVAWIDRDAYMAIGESPIARSLYQFAAGEVARGRVADWVYDLQELRDTLGLNPNHKPARIRMLLEKAGELLVSHRVFSRLQVEKIGRGDYRVHITPGPLLGIARMLRGVGIHELREAQVQQLLLGTLGINGMNARKLITQSANDVYLALAYLAYVERTQGGKGRIESPAGWLINMVHRGVALDTDQQFVSWLDEQIRASPKEEQRSLPLPLPLAPPSLSPPRISAAAEILPARDVQAVQMWNLLLPDLRALFPTPVTQSALGELAPYELSGDALVLRTKNSFASGWLNNRGLPDLGALLQERTNGRVQRLEILLVGENDGEIAEAAGDQ